MAESAHAKELRWFNPTWRAVLPLDGLKVSRSLRKVVRRGSFAVHTDTAFDAVVAACAAPRPGRPETWINSDIRRLYGALHAQGAAHSMESWCDGALVGGLYGVALGGAFFGESMFSTAPDASKVALVHLVARLRAAGYRLLDVQMQSDHMARLGTIEIPRTAFLRQLEAALRRRPTWPADTPIDALDRVLAAG